MPGGGAVDADQRVGKAIVPAAGSLGHLLLHRRQIDIGKLALRHVDGEVEPGRIELGLDVMPDRGATEPHLQQMFEAGAQARGDMIGRQRDDRKDAATSLVVQHEQPHFTAVGHRQQRHDHVPQFLRRGG